MWNQSLAHVYTESIWRLNWNVTGCMLVVSYGVDGVDMWKEMLDGKWKLVNKKTELNSFFLCLKQVFYGRQSKRDWKEE